MGFPIRHKLAIIVIIIAALLLSMQLNTAQPTPLVDITSVRTLNNGEFEIPGDPGEPGEVWIDYDVNMPNIWVFIGVYNRETRQWTRQRMEFYENSGHYQLITDGVSPIPNSYEVWAYYFDDPNWMVTDRVAGFIPIDAHVQGATDWSPNMYTRAYRRASGRGSDYINYSWWFWYWDNAETGNNQGTQRLEFLQDRTNGLLPGGQLQLEFSRGDQEGWDAMYCDLWPICYLYGWSSNLPGATATPCFTVEESEFAFPCGPDEEAEAVTENTEGMTAVSGADPTDVFIVSPNMSMKTLA